MAINKEDLSYKKLINKEFTDDARNFFQESTVSTFDINSEEVYTDVITSDTASMISDGVVRQLTQFILTSDPTYTTNAWYLLSGSGFTPGVDGYTGNTDKIQRNFVSDKYGANYEVKLYDNGGSQIFKTDAINWYFDYKTGILHVADPGAYTTPYKVSVLQYTGLNLSASLSSLNDTISSGATSKWTGSNPISRQSDVEITGSLSITDNLVVFGSASFNYFHTIYQTSSVIYGSGSTKFGDTTDDTHEITGSLYTTGSQVILSTNEFYIYTPNGSEVVSVDGFNGILFRDLNQSASIDVENRELYDSTPSGPLVASLNWNNRQLIKSNGTTITVDWENGYFTGSLFGTASWAQNAITASHVDLVAGPNITINKVGTTFQITGSGGGGGTFPYTGDAQINGSLGVTGSVSNLLTITNLDSLTNGSTFQYTGEVVEVLNLDGAVGLYDTVVLGGDNVWRQNDINTEASSSRLLGVCIDVVNQYVLLEGMLTCDYGGQGSNVGPIIAGVSASPGDPVYLRGGGALTTNPASSGQVSRIVGYLAYQNQSVTDDYVLKFKPSNDWFTVA